MASLRSVVLQCQAEARDHVEAWVEQERCHKVGLEEFSKLRQNAATQDEQAEVMQQRAFSALAEDTDLAEVSNVLAVGTSTAQRCVAACQAHGRAVAQDCSQELRCLEAAVEQLETMAESSGVPCVDEARLDCTALGSEVHRAALELGVALGETLGAAALALRDGQAAMSDSPGLPVDASKTLAENLSLTSSLHIPLRAEKNSKTEGAGVKLGGGSTPRTGPVRRVLGEVSCN